MDVITDPKVLEELGHFSAIRYVEPVFLAQLKHIDDGLEPRWNPVKTRWEIWRNNRYILTVQTVSGEYAPLDNRVFQKLLLCDTHRFANESQYIYSLHQQDNELRTMHIKEQDEYMRSIWRDMTPMLRGRKSVVANHVMRSNKCHLQ